MLFWLPFRAQLSRPNLIATPGIGLAELYRRVGVIASEDHVRDSSARLHPVMDCRGNPCGQGVVVNLATEWKMNPWAWVAVAGLTLAVAGVSWWMFRS